MAKPQMNIDKSEIVFLEPKHRPHFQDYKRKLEAFARANFVTFSDEL